MILFLPIGVETNLRRLPWVTLVLIALNTLVFGIMTASISRDEMTRREKARAEIGRVTEWEVRKAGGEDSAARALMERSPSPLTFLRDAAAWRSALRDGALKTRLEGLLAELLAQKQSDPYASFGFIPAEKRLPSFITHMFVHGGFFHLFFNMFFLWITGAVLENTWGRAVFSLVYLMSGIAAALAHAAFYPASTDPAIGASGAVAGVMGALAVQHAGLKIRVLFIYFLALVPRVRFASVPAWFFLGLWAAEQVFFGLLTMDAPMGVGFWAHIGGFGFGAAAGALMRFVPGRPVEANP